MIVSIIKSAPDSYDMFNREGKHLGSFNGKSTIVERVLHKVGDEGWFHVLLNRDGTLKSVVAQASRESFS